MTQKFLRMALCLALITAVAWSIGSRNLAMAQGLGGTATLSGQVTDQSGAVVPNVSLSLTATTGGTPHTTISNAAGYYRFSSIRPGNYILVATMQGFGNVSIPNINLQVNQQSDIPVVLKPGTVVQEITVTAAAVALESQTSSLGGVINQTVNQQLPLILRDPTALVNLVPGVTSDHRQTTAADSSGISYQGRMSFEINGGYRAQSVFMVDGVDVTILAGSFASTPMIATPDFTQEFKVQTNNIGPEFGRGNAVMNVVTRSGTNAVHGAVFEFLQNNHLNAQDLFSNRIGAQKSQAKRNQYGFALGGPVYLPHYDGRNKTFWFVNFEQLKQRRALPVSVMVPNAAQMGGDFSNTYALSGAPIIIYNPYDTYVDNVVGSATFGKTLRRPFAGNKFNPTAAGGLAVDPAFASKVLSYYPAPNNAGLLGPGGQYTGIANYHIAGSAPLNWNRYDVKIDHMLGSSHRFMFRWSRSHYQVIPLDIFHNAASSQGYSTRDNTQPGNNIVGSWTWAASPTTVLTTAVNISRFKDDSNQPLFDPTPLGGPFASGAISAYLNKYTGGGAFPNITVGSFATMGNGFGNNFNEPQYNYGYMVGLNHTRGRHNLRAGAHIQNLMMGDNLYKGFGGNFGFGGGFTCGPNPLNCSSNTGSGLADLLLGLVGGGSMNAAFASTYKTIYVAGYFADDFRVTPKLTLNLGVRYEVTRPYTEVNDHEWRFDPYYQNPIGNAVGVNAPRGVNAVLSGLGARPLQGAVVFPSSPGMQGRGMVPTDWSNFSPRLGFAYQITPKLVLRGGFSKLYGLSPVTPGPSTPGNGTFGAATTITATIDGIHPIVDIRNPFPAGFAVPTYDTLGVASLLGTGVTGGATGNVTPFAYEFNVGFQYELPQNSLLGIAYAGSRQHRMTCAFFFCGDQIPNQLIQQYGSHVNDTVPNPFYGIITDPKVALSSATVRVGQLLKQWPAYSNWTAVLPPWQGPDPSHDTFGGQFDSLQAQLTKRFSGGLTLVAAYTFSKDLTNSDSFEAGYLGPAVGYQNTYDYKGEWSLAATDVTHRLVIGHVYDLPIGKGKRFGSNMPAAVDMVLGHWQWSGMTEFASGFPIHPGVSGVNAGGFGGGIRPNLVPGANACGDMGRSRGEKILMYMNPGAFTKPASFLGPIGTAPRMLNGCRMDGIKNFDIAIIKIIPIHEKVNAEFRSEFYNGFNRPKLGGPNATAFGGAFGSITSQANAPRIIQFGLKINF